MAICGGRHMALAGAAAGARCGRRVGGLELGGLAEAAGLGSARPMGVGRWAATSSAMANLSGSMPSPVTAEMA